MLTNFGTVAMAMKTKQVWERRIQKVLSNELRIFPLSKGCYWNTKKSVFLGYATKN